MDETERILFKSRLFCVCRYMVQDDRIVAPKCTHINAIPELVYCNFIKKYSNQTLLNENWMLKLYFIKYTKNLISQSLTSVFNKNLYDITKHSNTCLFTSCIIHNRYHCIHCRMKPR